MKKPALIYTLHTESTGTYRAGRITILAPKSWRPDDYDQSFELRWQETGTEPGRWYGCSLHVEFNGSTSDFLPKTSHVAKVLGKLFPPDKYESDAPGAVIERLEALGIQRAAYDARVSTYVLERNKIDPTFRKYYDDVKAYDLEEARSGAGCHVNALAPDEETAKRELEKAFLVNIAKGYSKAESFAKWIAAGRPLRVASYDTAPSYPSFSTLFRIQPETETAAAA